MELKRHELSASWPDASEEDAQAIRDSMEDTGQLEPIVLLDGDVLDGWQRYLACKALGLDPITEDFTGDDPISYVRARHARRSHTPAQRLTALHLMAKWLPPNRPGKSAPSADLLPPAAKLAEQEGVSTRTVEQVRSAVSKGAPELVEAMKRGEVSPKRAEQIAKLPKSEQQAAIAAPPPPKPPVAPPRRGPTTEAVVDLNEQVLELQRQLEAVNEQIATLEAVVSADDQVTAALAEAKKWREMVPRLQARIQSMTDEIAGYKRQIAAMRKAETA